MKHIFKLLIMAILASSCNGNAQVFTPPPKSFIVVLDLSDRLLNINQAQNDIAVINAVFSNFEKAVQKNLTVKSKDKFSVKIIPQPGSNLQQNDFENKLQIDMSALSGAFKNIELNKFRTGLNNTLNLLYKNANLGKKSSNYAGVDIWSYLNNESIIYTKSYNNYVIIITDGYFDFNDNRAMLHKNNEHTNSAFLSELNGLSWQIKADRDSYGIIPVILNKNVNWIIAGISSKNKNDILEAKKLQYIWKKWIISSGGSRPDFILNTSSIDMTNQVKTMLATN